MSMPGDSNSKKSKGTLQNRVGCLTTGWLPWLHTSWRHSGYERFTLLCKTNCTKQPGTVAQFILNHTDSPQSHTNALKGCHGELECSLMQAGDLLTIVSVLWLYNELGSCLSSCLIYNKNKPLITTISLASLQPG